LISTLLHTHMACPLPYIISNSLPNPIPSVSRSLPESPSRCLVSAVCLSHISFCRKLVTLDQSSACSLTFPGHPNILETNISLFPAVTVHVNSCTACKHHLSHHHPSDRDLPPPTLSPTLIVSISPSLTPPAGFWRRVSRRGASATLGEED
jgi:hypothetical protein